MSGSRWWLAALAVIAAAVVVVVIVTQDGGRDRPGHAAETRPTTTRGIRETPATTATSTTTTLITTTSVPEDDPSTTTTGPTTSVPTGAGFGAIGVVGCSNTAQHVDGYTLLSDQDRLVPGPLGGGELSVWGDPADPSYASYWSTLEAGAPAGGFDAYWVQMCLRGADAGNTAAHEEWLRHIIERLRTGRSEVTVFVSGLNIYEDGHYCRKTGDDGVPISWDLARWSVEALGTVLGPETGPIGPETVDQDGCHLSPAGEELVGRQLVEFFDSP